MIKAVGFDLGDTLIEYKNMPLSWESLYADALSHVLIECKGNASDNDIAIGKEMLLRYNTRIHTRDNEVEAKEIFSKILDEWNVKEEFYLERTINIFFESFQNRAEVFYDTFDILKYLKQKEIKVGILTDVPYGMPKKLVAKDVEKFNKFIDCLLTSVDVGHRKPNKKGYVQLAEELSVLPNEMIYIGNEEKDMIGANNANSLSVFIDRNNSCKQYQQKKTINSLLEIKGII